MEFTTFQSEMMPEGALTSFTVCGAYRYFEGQACVKKKVTWMDDSIVFDHFFNLTKNLISLADFNTSYRNF